MRVTMFDYGAGNLYSLGKALSASSHAAVIAETDPRRALDTDVLVLPGVGAFGAAASALAPAREEMRAAIAGGLPTLGICLGMQLFFNASDESDGVGLGVIPGRVGRLDARRVPHIGWNSVVGTDALLDELRGERVYYANSFVARPKDAAAVTAWTTHEEDRFPAVVRVNRAIGIQFHPEKSSAAGLRLLVAALAECAR
jgi:glutamine amidotransferase